jgi:hypothetical protein
MKAAPSPAPKKSKAPLFVGMGAGAVLALGAALLLPKAQPNPTQPVPTGAKSYPFRGNPTPSDLSNPSGRPPATATKDAPYVNMLGMKFVPVTIPGGPTGGQRVLFSVWDTRVQDYEVFAKETKREWPKPTFAQGPTHPAVNVSWDDAQAFCQWLTGREQAAGQLPAGFIYRLPSDHEWSCAAGIGERESPAKLPAEKDGKIKDAFPWGTQWPPPAGAGNYNAELKVDEFEKTSPVGSFVANQKGLYDMGGNVWQWCEDRYDTGHKSRVLRGASWYVSVEFALRSAFRAGIDPSDRDDYFGFRCVLVISGG